MAYKKDNTSRKNKTGYVDENTLDYYRKALGMLSDIEGEEKELFLDNVFTELEAELLRVSLNQTVSKLIERLLGDAKPVHIRKLLVAFSKDWMTCSTDRFASQVFQDVIALSPMCRHIDEDSTSEPDLILEYYGFVQENIETLLTDTYGSHIVRVLLEVLGGVDVSKDIITSRMSKDQLIKDNIQWPSKVNPPEVYASCFHNLMKKIFSVCNYSDHFVDPCASPVFQIILLILKEKNNEKCQKYILKILKRCDVGTHIQDSGLPRPNLVQDEVGAYLFEQIVALSINGEKRHKVFQKLFEGRLLSFASDRLGNYALQKLLDCVADEELFKKIFDELSNHVEEILRLHHVRVITQLAAACIRLHTCQKRFVKVLMSAFHCFCPEERHVAFAPLLLSFSKYEEYYNPKSYDDDCVKNETTECSTEKKISLAMNKLHYQGSLLVQHLLKFDKNKIIASSLLQLKPEELKFLSCDKCGSFVMNVFYQSSTITQEKKSLLLQRMKGVLFDIACDRNGSRAVQSMWESCSLKQKTDIAQELLKHESELRRDYFGKFVHMNCAISEFKRSNNSWMSAQARAGKRRKFIQDILTDSDDISSKKMKHNSERSQFKSAGSQNSKIR